MAAPACGPLEQEPVRLCHPGCLKTVDGRGSYCDDCEAAFSLAQEAAWNQLKQFRQGEQHA